MPFASSAPAEPQLPEKDGRSWLRVLLDTPETRQSYIFTCIGLWSFCIYLIVTNFVGGTVEIDGDSMMPTLINGRTYLLNRWSFHFRPPRRGELVVIRDPGYTDMAVKRVVALGGELVEFRNHAVFINGERFTEPYLPPGLQTFPAKTNAVSFKIPKNHFFVLGDNRPNSLDSRYYGALYQDNIIGLVSPWKKK